MTGRRNRADWIELGVLVAIGPIVAVIILIGERLLR